MSNRKKHTGTQAHRTRLKFERLESRTLMSVNGDFNGDGFDDLAIGAPGETIGGMRQAGAVSIIHGSRRGLSTTGNQFWHQGVPGIDGSLGESDRFGQTLAVGDFNGDGFSDLAIGAFGETVRGKPFAGAVNVLYGSSRGLTASNDQLWTQDSPGIHDTPEGTGLFLGDGFGATLAAGDFNGDGRDDLAIGVPGESVGTLDSAGAVHALYGSSSGLRSTNSQFWTQNSGSTKDLVEARDGFGTALAAGDFDGDGCDDLAIGVPRESVGSALREGAVNVLYGSTSRLTSSGNQFWHQNSAGVADSAERDDRFGQTLAAGDFNRDGRDDLAIGVPEEDVGTIVDAGRVNLLYGSSAKLRSGGNFKQQLTAESLGFTSIADASFGGRLATGDFDSDGRYDLAIGAAQETVAGQGGAGAVYVASGSTSVGLIVTGAQRWLHSDFGGTVKPGDLFGVAMATGDYNGDGYADLAIGAPNATPGAVPIGIVCVLYDSSFTDAKRPFWQQGLLSSTDGAEDGDQFGFGMG